MGPQVVAEHFEDIILVSCESVKCRNGAWLCVCVLTPEHLLHLEQAGVDMHQSLRTMALQADGRTIGEQLNDPNTVGSFHLLHELTVAGLYEAHFFLGDKPLAGSPVKFKVKAAQPSGRVSTLHPPETPSVIGVLYELLLVAEDKYGNKLDRGGASVQARALGPRTLLASHRVVLAHAANDAREGGVPEAAEAEAAEDEGTREGGRTVAGRRVRG